MICVLKRHRAAGALAAAMLVAAFATGSRAQEQEQPVAKLTGTLAKVNGSGTITLGYREASFPFSYLGPANQPMGYSIDLCQAIVDEIGREIDKPQLKVAYLAVTPETRMAAVVSGKIDLECGSTTNNAERQKQVAFSPIMFVSGTKLMVKRRSGIKSYHDLKGKVVVVTAGTTNEQVMKRLNEKFQMGANLISARDHEDSYSLVVDDKADAFATDDILLYGLIAHHNAQRDLIVVGDFLSYDPYGIMFRKNDAPLNDLVVKTFQQLAESRDLVLNYDKWFVRKTPTGERINLPIGPQLEEIFRVLGVTD
ncbi:MAG TPA: amino acid ABC transporter substrate-binding protein [Xanthobacteraceae bacterium]|nr:amino acid ABC transporter substrate-binding protein [Xanthobacteraceae bacterium]